MTALSVSNSWKTRPTRFMACTAGASSGLIDTACASPTASSCGTTIFVTAASPSQKSRMGTESRRTVRAITRTSPGNRFGGESPRRFVDP